MNKKAIDIYINKFKKKDEYIRSCNSSLGKIEFYPFKDKSGNIIQKSSLIKVKLK
jgi:hypothetical protein